MLDRDPRELTKRREGWSGYVADDEIFPKGFVELTLHASGFK